MSALRPEKGRDLNFHAVVNDSKFMGLFFSTLIVVGSCQAFFYNLWRILALDNRLSQLDNFADNFWVSDVLGRLLGGLIAYLVGRQLHDYFFGFVGAMIAAFGFGL